MATFLYPPTTVTTLPPVGGATAANQLLELAELQDINVNTAAPIRIRKNGTVQEVNKDTGTPANTVAVPVEIVSASGTTINITAGDINIQTTSEGSNFDSMRIGSGSGFFAEVTSNNDLSTFDSLSFTELVEINQQTMSIDLKTPNLGPAVSADSTPVVLASDSPAIPTSPQALTASFQQIINLTTAAQTIPAPPGAKWMKISADANNIDNIRFKLGGVATITSGIRLEPSRTEDLAVAGNVSVIAESGTNQIVCVIFGA